MFRFTIIREKIILIIRKKWAGLIVIISALVELKRELLAVF